MNPGTNRAHGGPGSGLELLCPRIRNTGTYPLFGIGKASQILFLHPVEFEVLNLGPFRAYCLLLSFREFGQ